MSESSQQEPKRKEYAPRRPFPVHTLEQALEVANAIQNKNAGKPWKPFFVADALKIKATSTNFRDITSSAFKYGLTVGTWKASYISLAPLGQSITKPIDSKQEIKAKQNAVLEIEVFKSIYEHYRDARFPSADTYFKNMLESEFKVPRQLVDDCIRLLIENGKFTHILQESQGDLFVVFSEEAPPSPSIPEVPAGGGEKSLTDSGVSLPQLPSAPTPAPIVNQIFVVHGKNKVPLEQLKKILTEFKIPFKVAIDEPHIGRPIPQKVIDLMKTCTSAIVIFTADEEYIDADGKKIFRPSDNAVYELGAASIQYGNKIVILKEDCVSLASDFGDLGYIMFEKDKLDAKTIDLFKEFMGSGLLKVTTA